MNNADFIQQQRGVVRNTVRQGLERKAQWMCSAQDMILAARPEMAGKLEWEALTYYFNEGETPDYAADQYVKNRS